MRQEPEHRMPSLGALIDYGLVIAGALYVTVYYGLGGLIGAAFLAVPVLLLMRRESEEDEQPRTPMPTAFNEQKFGPTLDEQLCDPAYNAYAENCFHKHYHGKD